jgi:L-lactate utilization protein LutB
MEDLVEKCVRCNICVKECAFLKKYGTPGAIADSFASGGLDGVIAFDCSLCGLCTSLCPKDLDPCKAFLAIRRKVFAATGKILPEHKGIAAYEKKGRSGLFSAARSHPTTLEEMSCSTQILFRWKILF